MGEDRRMREKVEAGTQMEKSWSMHVIHVASAPLCAVLLCRARCWERPVGSEPTPSCSPGS
eukprot:12712436-Alexandrium_andersonii.AAC.1